MPLPEQLKAARLRLGLTQAEAATVCGVSARAYWQWEAGKSTLDVTLEGALERLRSAKKRPTRKGQNASAMAPPPQRLPSTKDVPGG